jgi:hypothetical protein
MVCALLEKLPAVPFSTTITVSHNNGACRRTLLEALDAAFCGASALVEDAIQNGLDPRPARFRQEWLREGLRRFLSGDDAGARHLLDQVGPRATVAVTS